MAQKITVALAAYDQNNQKLPGTQVEFQIEQADLPQLSIPEGYTWPEGTMYLGFWLIEYSQMLIKIVPTNPEEAVDPLVGAPVPKG